MSSALLTLTLHHEQDVVTARQRSGQIAAILGFDRSEQTRIATSVSEIVRNAFRHAGGGRIEFRVEGVTPPQLFTIRVIDAGRGISNLDAVLTGAHRSKTGMGIGLDGARRLMDHFEIQSTTAGTTVVLKKLLPRRSPLFDADRLSQISRDLAARKPADLVDESQTQNQELLRALDEFNRRQDDLLRLNRELEDTNRGVVALYAELDEKADYLQRADELKSRFLSNMTHEFRTPVNAILALTGLLEGRDHVEPEVPYIRKAAEQLSDLVNDLLDLAKVEAGKTVVKVVDFEVDNLFGALRGMLRPLLANQSVSLTFEDPIGLPTMRTDEGKVSQILRNFISNALKYTERGEVRVSARLDEAAGDVIFSVSDTGIGIAPEDQSRVFDEFAQLDHPIQRNYKGTGLGLPLSRRLAELLGGRLSLTSEVGRGSTFSAAIPVQFRRARHEHDAPEYWTRDPARLPVLVIEDAMETQLYYDRILKSSPFQIYPVYTSAGARHALTRIRPAAIVLDILIGDEQMWQFLADVKAAPDTAAAPVIVISTVDDRDKGLALGADAYAVKPVDRQWLLETLERLTRIERAALQVLVIDDQEAMRFVFGQLLVDPRYALMLTGTGREGLQRAREKRPDVILLDLGLPDLPGVEVLRALKADPLTAEIPVVVVTSAGLDRAQMQQLTAAAAVVSKQSITRDVLVHAIDGALRPQLAPEGMLDG